MNGKRCPVCNTLNPVVATHCSVCSSELGQEPIYVSASEPDNTFPNFDEIEAQKKLSEKELMIFNAELDRQKRNVGIAYLLWFFLGSLGIHKFYLGRNSAGAGYLLLGIFGYVFIIGGSLAGEAASGLSAIVVGALMLACVGILLLVDLFTLPKQAREYTTQIKAQLIKRLSA